MYSPTDAATSLGASLEEKIARLQAWLASQESVLVAYSGGIDSTFLAFMAHRALGPSMLACTAYSEIYPDRETKAAEEIAREIGIPFCSIRSHELSNPKFQENSPTRCFFCKQELFGRLLTLAKERGLRLVVDGQNKDDQADFRPGRRAARELDIESPLAALGFSKDDIRQAARRFALPNWDKPSHPCLSTRFPFGKRITTGKLRIVDSVEDFLRGLGLRDLRLRVHEDVARIEVRPEDFSVLMEPRIREAVVERLLQEGFSHVCLDLEGLISGKMNRSLKREPKRDLSS